MGDPLFDKLLTRIRLDPWFKQHRTQIFDRPTKFNSFIIKESFLNLNNTILMRNKE